MLLKLLIMLFEQCSKIKPIMLKIMPINSNYAHWYCKIQHFKVVFNLNFIEFLLIMQTADSMIPVNFWFCYYIHINSAYNLLTWSLQIH